MVFLLIWHEYNLSVGSVSSILQHAFSLCAAVCRGSPRLIANWIWLHWQKSNVHFASKIITACQKLITFLGTREEASTINTYVPVMRIHSSEFPVALRIPRTD